MNCQTNCVKAKCLIAPVYCNQNNQVVIIGEIQSQTPGTGINIWVQDAANGWMRVTSTVTDSLGRAVLPMEGLVGMINPNGYYNVWVTLDGAAMSDQLHITMPNDSEIYCVALSFDRALGSGGFYCPDEQIVEI